jgi:hypothetical protein
LKGNPVSTAWLRATLDKFYNKGTSINENLTECTDRYISEVKSGKLLATIGKTKKQYSWHSLQSMQGFMLFFKKFSEESGKQYDFNDIQPDF